MKEPIAPHLIDQFPTVSPERRRKNCPYIRGAIVVPVFRLGDSAHPIRIYSGKGGEIEFSYDSLRRLCHRFLIQRPGVMMHPSRDERRTNGVSKYPVAIHLSCSRS